MVAAVAVTLAVITILLSNGQTRSVTEALSLATALVTDL